MPGLSPEGQTSMYPLKTIVISRDENLLPEVRRELLNAAAEIDGCYPDISTVVERVSLNHDELRLFIVHLDSIDDLAPLKHLSGVYAGRPILALVDGNQPATSVIHAMREGATQVVLIPFQSEDFREALQSIETQFGHAIGKSRLIAVTGSHGGAGATTISVNLAYEIAQTFQLDCILLELSANIGVLSSYLNIEPKHSTRDVLEMGEELDVYALQNALTPFGDHFSVLPGPLHASLDFRPTHVAVQRLIQCVRQMADVVILDVPAALGADEYNVLDAADVVALVGEQTMPSIQMTCENLRLGIRALSPVVVVNRYDAELEGFDADHLAQVFGTDRLRTISADHLSVNASINCGSPLRMISPYSPALADLDGLAEELLGKRSGQHRRRGFLGRLAHALGADRLSAHKS